MTMVLEETLRLCPPVWIFHRRAVADDELLGHRIPAGTTVALCPYLLHRHRAHWDEPERFDPERFSPERARHARHARHAYLPFGWGPHQCIGNAFALMEMQVVVAMVVARYRVRPSVPLALAPEVTLRPRRGMPATLVPRGGEGP